MREIRRGFVVGAILFTTTGCSRVSMPMLNPEGYVGRSGLELLVITTVIMALVIVPVIAGTLWIAWRYRSSAGRTDYDPDFTDSKLISGVTIFVPLITIAALGTMTWIYTHRLDPYRPLGTTERPYEIQAVSLDYKWLFIYPEAGVATINQLVAPSGQPVTIRITSDPMMTSIFIPGLINQIYAMPGMETRANFLADNPEQREGANAMYSGPGFEHQRFITHILAPDDFAAWAKGAAEGKSLEGAEAAKVEEKLDMAYYKKLVVRSNDVPITYFKSIDADLFQDIVRLYMPQYQMSSLPTGAEYMGAN